jgi:hypothetical protein
LAALYAALWPGEGAVLYDVCGGLQVLSTGELLAWGAVRGFTLACDVGVLIFFSGAVAGLCGYRAMGTLGQKTKLRAFLSASHDYCMYST